MKKRKILIILTASIISAASNNMVIEAAGNLTAVQTEALMMIESKKEAAAYIRACLLQRERMIKFTSSKVAMTKSEFKELVLEAARKPIKGNSASGDYLRHLFDIRIYNATENNGKYEYWMQVSYRETAEQTDKVDKKIRTAVKKSKGMNNYKKLRYLSKWIVNHTDYDYSVFDDGETAFKALRVRGAKCLGYSMLAQKLFTEAGLKSRIVIGKVRSGGRHAWNAIKLGKWYYIDTTWMDCGASGRINYEYFLFGNKKCRKERIIETEYKLKGISKSNY